ncbi:MAG: Holliday junction resolvase RuvX [Roseivirga sp.]
MMGRILAIDYGVKRVGIAVTDPLKLIATPLTTVPTAETLSFLQTYVEQEEIEALVVGMPKRLDNTASAMTAMVKKFTQTLQKKFPDKKIIQQDERYTSKLALASMIEGGFKKKDRRNKAHLDKLSATLILQSFLNTSSSIQHSDKT